MFLAIIIIGAFIGLILAFIIAPIIVLSGKAKLKQMRNKIAEFDAKTFATAEEKDIARNLLKRELVAIKSKIPATDKDATIKAGDLLSLI